MHKYKLWVGLFYVISSTSFFGYWLQVQRHPSLEVDRLRSYEVLEQQLLYQKFRWVRTSGPAEDVVVVTFDAEATKVLGPFPWPREIFGKLILKLRELGARTIVMDLIFADPQLKFLSPAAYRSLFPDLPLDQVFVLNQFAYVAQLRSELEKQQRALAQRVDQGQAASEQMERFIAQKGQLLTLSEHIAQGDANLAFERAVGQASDVFFPTDFFNLPRINEPGPAAINMLLRMAQPGLKAGKGIRAYRRTMTLYPQLLARGVHVGVNEIDRTERPFITNLSLVVQYRDKLFLSTMTQAVAHFLGQPLRLALGPAGAPKLTIGTKNIPLDPDGTFPLDYYSERSFPRTVPAIGVLRDWGYGYDLKNKLVIIDVQTDEILRFQQLPIPVKDTMLVSNIKATLASNLLKGHRGPTSERPLGILLVEGSFIWLMAPLFFFLAFRTSLLHSVWVSLALLASLVAADLLVIMPARIWLRSGGLGLQILFFMLASVVAHYLIQRTERQKVRRAFGFYLPSTVLEHVLHDEKALRLGGERRELSILFSDIRSFTNLSEKANPEALGEALNTHLTALTEQIFLQGGTLDKYMGDCIMAFFGAPVAFTSHAEKAVLAALNMQRRLREIQPVWQQKCGSAVQAGIGVATGEVIVGNMGSETLFDYTVIGDNVNLASRLEGLTKEYGVEVLISEETRRQAGEGICFLEVDRVRVKGKGAAVSIFEVVCQGQPDQTRQRYNESCTAGIAAYRERDWPKATAYFEEAQRIFPVAKLPSLYLARVEMLSAQQLPADWEGVTKFDHK
jgi:class 3 adenylate cyclase